MLVLFRDFVINLANVHSFWCSNSLNGQAHGFYLKFSDSTGQKDADEEVSVMIFDSEESRDKAFRDICMNYQTNVRILAILTKEEEEASK